MGEWVEWVLEALWISSTCWISSADNLIAVNSDVKLVMDLWEK